MSAAGESLPPPTAPGWYPHPAAPGWEAYWTGSAWANETRPVAQTVLAGTSAYTFEIPFHDAPDRVPAVWLPTFASIASEAGYALKNHVPGSATYERQYSPGIYWAGYILLFPIGLVLLLVRPTQSLTVTWVSSPEGASIRVAGNDKRLTTMLQRVSGSRRIA